MIIYNFYYYIMSSSEDIQLQKLMLYFAPENIESSKICSFFNDNLELSLTELLSNPEISKITNDKENLVKCLEKLSYTHVSDKDSVKLNISSEFNVFSLVNLPLNVNEEKLQQAIPLLKEKAYLRFYKKSIFWIIILDKADDANKLEEQLKNASIEETKILFERTTTEDIKKRITKQVNNNNYNKDSCGLKKSDNKSNNNDYASVSSHKMSWRKKSNDTTEQMAKGKPVSNFAKGVRERYHSDGQQSGFKPKPRFEEIEIDLSKINYSLKLKHKYTNRDLLLYYDKFRINKIFEEKPKFEVFIDEICSSVKRKEFNFLKRERSMTYSIPVQYKNSKYDDIKLNLDAPSYKIPSKNPITAGNFSNIQINK